MAAERKQVVSRRTFLAASAATMTGIPAACGTPAEKGPTSQAVQKPASIVYTQWGGAPIFELIDKANNTYMQRFPQIKIRTEQNPTDYMNKILTQITAGTAPDLMLMADRDLPVVTGANGFENLTPYVAKTRSFKRDDYFPVGLANSTLRGNLYALPDVIDVDMLFYNKALFAEAGVRPPSANWTWEDHLHAARAIHREKAGTQFFGVAAYNSDWPSWVFANGGSIFDGEGKRFLLDRPEAIEALEWVGDLRSKHKVVIEDPQKELGVDMTNSFGTGRVGMLHAEGWQFKYYRNPTLDWQATLLPKHPKTGKVIPLGYVLSIGIFTQSKEKEAAWHWLPWWEGIEGWDVKIAAGWDKLPTIKQAATKKAWLVDVEGADRNKKAYVDSALIAKGYPITKNIPEALTAIGRELGAGWRGEKSFRVLVTGMADQINAILAR